MSRLMKKSLLKKIKILGFRHGLFSFIFIILMTIAVTRLLILIKNSNLIINGFELHYFYYEVLLLLIVNLLIFFWKKNHDIAFILSAISAGLIANEFITIFGKGVKEKYFLTFFSTIVFVLVTIIDAGVDNKLF